MKATILAVGTELTTGQITNRNAAWLSDRLTELGINVILHETVPDDRPLITHALNHCRSLAPLILVSGGLGPTTDDFTREVIADWMGQPLEFHDPSWQHIVNRLAGLGIHNPPEINRRQCWFPKGATVIPNSQGTAAAFGVRHEEAHIWVFPGPPREVATVWEAGIRAAISALVPPETKKLKLFTWQCIGKSEAELGVLTEAALNGSGLQTGYRAHRPFVEIKVWCPEDEVSKSQVWFEKLEGAIGKWVITKQGEDLAAALLSRIGNDKSVRFEDAVSLGYFSDRMGALLKKPRIGSTTLLTTYSLVESPAEWVSARLSEPGAGENSIVFAIAGFSREGKWAFGMRNGPLRKIEERELAFGKRLNAPGSAQLQKEILERNRPLTVELALKGWIDWLDPVATK